MKINRKLRYGNGMLFLSLGILMVLLVLPDQVQSRTDNTGFSLNAFGGLQNQQANIKKGPFGEDPKIIVEPKRIEDLAKTDHVTLLNWSLETYQKRVHDYTGTFLKQERINGKLKKTEQIAIMFKEKPFSIFMQWEKNAGSGDKMLYVEGSNDNQMLVHPTGLWAWIKSVQRDPQGKDAKKAALRTCDQFGFYRSMKSLVELYETAQKRGDLKTRSLGETKVDGRPCIALERILPKDKYPYPRTVVEIDVEYLLPVKVSMYDGQNQLIGNYIFLNLKFNTGLTNDRFTPKACKL